MAVTREQVENALAMALDDELVEDSDISKLELGDIQNRFIQLMAVLKNEANEEVDEDV